MTARERLTDILGTLCMIENRKRDCRWAWTIERDASIQYMDVNGAGPRFIFTADGELRSVIRDRKSYRADAIHVLPYKTKTQEATA